MELQVLTKFRFRRLEALGCACAASLGIFRRLKRVAMNDVEGALTRISPIARALVEAAGYRVRDMFFAQVALKGGQL